MSNVQDRKLNVEFLPKGGFDPQFQQRESGVVHTPYSREVAFYTCVKNGDLQGLQSNMASFMQEYNWSNVKDNWKSFHCGLYKDKKD